MIVFKVMLVPIRLLLGTAKVSAKAGYKTAKTGAVAGAKTAVGSAKLGYNTGRAVGYGRSAVFAAGVTVGVLGASPKARAAVGRAASAAWGIARRTRGPSDADVAESVRRRLAGTEATWKLPQPTVTVTDGRARLDGEAPDSGGRRILAETASEAEGVREVDNRILVVAGADGDSGAGAGSGTGAVRDDADGSSPSGNGAAAASSGGARADTP